jgi:hypothetical protein
MMNWFDRVVLLATGLVAIYLLYRFYGHYRQKRSAADIWYLVGFGVLLVAGLLLIAFTYDALENPLVVIVSYLIPAGISLGLVAQFYPQYSKGYLAFVILGVILISITKLLEMETPGKIVLPIFHATAGLIIFFLPMVVVRAGKAVRAFLWVSVGGALIGLGGIALAFLKGDSQLLFFSSEVVFAILAPLLLLTTLAFAWGFMKEMSAEDSETAVPAPQ